MMTGTLLVLMCLVATTMAFKSSFLHSSRARTDLKATFKDASSWSMAELYASPTARYNGELIDQKLKLVEPKSKPADYDYGAVSSDGAPFLAVGALLAVCIAALIPFILSIGESAQAQQRDREASDFTIDNAFARDAKSKLKGKK